MPDVRTGFLAHTVIVAPVGELPGISVFGLEDRCYSLTGRGSYF